MDRINEIKDRLRVIELGLPLAKKEDYERLSKSRLELLQELKYHWKNAKDKNHFRVY